MFVSMFVLLCSTISVIFATFLLKNVLRKATNATIDALDAKQMTELSAKYERFVAKNTIIQAEYNKYITDIRSCWLCDDIDIICSTKQLQKICIKLQTAKDAIAQRKTTKKEMFASRKIHNTDQAFFDLYHSLLQCNVNHAVNACNAELAASKTQTDAANDRAKQAADTLSEEQNKDVQLQDDTNICNKKLILAVNFWHKITARKPAYTFLSNNSKTTITWHKKSGKYVVVKDKNSATKTNAADIEACCSIMRRYYAENKVEKYEDAVAYDNTSAIVSWLRTNHVGALSYNTIRHFLQALLLKRSMQTKIRCLVEADYYKADIKRLHELNMPQQYQFVDKHNLSHRPYVCVLDIDDTEIYDVAKLEIPNNIAVLLQKQLNMLIVDATNIFEYIPFLIELSHFIT